MIAINDIAMLGCLIRLQKQKKRKTWSLGPASSAAHIDCTVHTGDVDQALRLHSVWQPVGGDPGA